VNEVGDIAGFERISSLTELESTLKPIDHFESAGKHIEAVRPLAIPVTLEFEERLFCFQNPSLGIDTFSDSYESLRDLILEELDMLWRQYATAPDKELDADALEVKAALHARFRATR